MNWLEGVIINHSRIQRQSLGARIPTRTAVPSRRTYPTAETAAFMSNESGSLVGIDLGTTLSVISHLDQNGIASTISNRDGDPLTPSAIYIDGTNAIVGKAAKQAASHNPDKVATFVKRSMGDRLYHRTVDGREFRPETLSAIILKKLKQDAERRIGPISKAVITVPAFFDDTRRKATEDAGRIAGLEVLDIINEPTAAAIAYCLESQLDGNAPQMPFDFEDETIRALVYDLGGGTFDVTIVQLGKQRFDTLATDGEVQLGGKDWDDAITRFIGSEFSQQHGFNPAEDPSAGQMWKESVANLSESTKKLLSQLTSAPIECFYQDRVLRTSLTREQFEAMSRDLLTRTQVVTSFVRDQAGLKWADIDRVLLVGGSTRMPMVQEMLEQVTERTPDESLDPDQVVSRGAAIFAGVRATQDAQDFSVKDNIKQKLKEVVVQDVNSHSLGIQSLDPKSGKSVNAVLIPKNTKLPFASSRVFKTSKADVTSVRVKVLEGEAPEASANIPIGECVVTDLSDNLPAKSPIQVRLNYSSNGRVSVMALDMTGGKLAQANIQRQARND